MKRYFLFFLTAFNLSALYGMEFCKDPENEKPRKILVLGARPSEYDRLKEIPTLRTAELFIWDNIGLDGTGGELAAADRAFLEDLYASQKNYINGDFNDIKFLQKISKTYKNSFDEIVCDKHVSQFFQWNYFHLQSFSDMLKPDGRLFYDMSSITLQPCGKVSYGNLVKEVTGIQERNDRTTTRALAVSISFVYLSPAEQEDTRKKLYAYALKRNEEIFKTAFPNVYISSEFRYHLTPEMISQSPDLCEKYGQEIPFIVGSKKEREKLPMTSISSDSSAEKKDALLQKPVPSLTLPEEEKVSDTPSSVLPENTSETKKIETKKEALPPKRPTNKLLRFRR